jgi:hypothetical protein
MCLNDMNYDLRYLMLDLYGAKDPLLNP